MKKLLSFLSEWSKNRKKNPGASASGFIDPSQDLVPSCLMRGMSCLFFEAESSEFRGSSGDGPFNRKALC